MFFDEAISLSIEYAKLHGTASAGKARLADLYVQLRELIYRRCFVPLFELNLLNFGSFLLFLRHPRALVFY